METEVDCKQWRIHYDSDIRAVRAQALPSLRGSDLPKFCEDVQQFARRLQCGRIMVDYSQMPEAPKSIDRASPALSAPADEAARAAQIAFVFDQLDRDIIHAGQVLRERGFTVGVFSDEWAAVDWLN
ncbi:MAG: hypothetical protein RL341_1842 [Pseudomonadota bacterium]|jgi:hypothetical protein